MVEGTVCCLVMGDGKSQSLACGLFFFFCFTKNKKDIRHYVIC